MEILLTAVENYTCLKSGLSIKGFQLNVWEWSGHIISSEFNGIPYVDFPRAAKKPSPLHTLPSGLEGGEEGEKKLRPARCRNFADKYSALMEESIDCHLCIQFSNCLKIMVLPFPGDLPKQASNKQNLYYTHIAGAVGRGCAKRNGFHNFRQLFPPVTYHNNFFSDKRNKSLTNMGT